LKNKEIFKRSKLIINSGDGTSFLETIAADIPTVAFLSNFNLITEEAKKDYEKLIEAKILFLDEKKMSDHINSTFDDINHWWGSKKIKKVKYDFEEKYAQRPPNNSLKILSNRILES
jgi:putative transferase (TIGR04331 family)